jgi:hypothetical protein
MGWFDGLLGGGGDAGADDPYGGLLTKAQISAMQDRKWAALAGALAEAGMPSRMPIPIGSALGKAAAAFGGSGPEKDALEQIAIAQKVKQAQYEYGLKQKYAPILEKLLAQQLGGGAKPLPVAAPASPAVATPVTPIPVTPTPARSVPAQVGAGEAGALSSDPSQVSMTVNYGGGGDEGGLLADPNDPLSSLPPEIRQILAARMQGGPAAGGTPATFPDDGRYTRMVVPASARTEDGVAGSSDDPRGKTPVILAAAQRYGVDPRHALAVAREEGLSKFSGDGGKSGGAFQLYTGGGLGNEFQRDTGLDPLDPKNEDATINYAMKRVAEGGWGPWSGARKLGLTGRGAGPLSVLGGGAGMAQGVAEATGTPGLPPALKGLLALAGSAGSGAANDPLSGLLTLAGAGGGDDGGALPGDLVTGLRRPAESIDPRAEPPAQPTSSARELAAYATGNARPGGPSSVEGLNPQFANAVSRMVADMPPEIRARFQIISGHRDAARQMEVNPSAPNSRHIPGLAADLGNDPAVLAWIRENGSKYDVGFPLPGAKEANHLEFLPGGYRTGGAGTRLPSSVTGVGSLPDVRGLLAPARGDEPPGLPPALQGLLSLTTSRGGDTIDDVLANLRNSGSSTAPPVAPPGAGEDAGPSLYPPPTPGQLATLAAMRGGDTMGGGDTAGGPSSPPSPSGVPSGMPNIPTGVPNLGTGGLPVGMMKPPALSLTPPGVPAAGGAPYDMSNARTLALADAMAQLAGLKMPFKELLELSFKDPAYARSIAQAQEEAKQAAGAPYKAQEQTNQAVLDQWKAVNQSYLDKQKEWAAKGLTQDANGNLVALPNADKMGLTPNAIQQAQKDLENIRTQHKLLEQGKMLDPKDPTRIIPVPGFNETTAATERAKTAATEEEKALGTVKTIVIAGPDGKPREVDVTLKEAGEISRGMGNARLGIPAMNAPAPAASGPAPGRPYYSPEQQEELKARGQATVKQAEAVDTEAKNAQSSRDTLTLVMNDLRNVHQGWGADTAYNFGRVMQVFDPAFKQSVASYESAEKALAEMTGRLVRATDPNPTLQQSERLLKSMPVRLNSEGGNERLYNRMAGFQDEAVNKSIAQQQYAKANGGTTAGFDGYWHQNVSPIAFVFRRMPSDQQAQMVLNLRQTESGKAELEKLKGQIDFIEKNGLTR